MRKPDLKPNFEAAGFGTAGLAAVGAVLLALVLAVDEPGC